MGVMMQAFYWDCPEIEGKPFQWWNDVRGEVPKLAAAGFTALWLPPANKAANNVSMGYDPYDFGISASSIRRVRSRPGSAREPNWSA